MTKKLTLLAAVLATAIGSAVYACDTKCKKAKDQTVAARGNCPCPHTAAATLTGQKGCSGKGATTLTGSKGCCGKSATTVATKAGCSGKGATTVASKKGCSGKSATTVAAKAGCSGKGAATVASKKGCRGKSATTVATKAGCGGKGATTVAGRKGCFGKGATTVATKAGCSGKGATIVASNKGCCGKTATTVASKSGCNGKAAAGLSAERRSKVETILASLPSVSYRVGELETGCFYTASTKADANRAALQYVVDGKTYDKQCDASAALTAMLNERIASMTEVGFAAGDQVYRCPISARQAAEEAKTPVRYRLAGFDFDEKEAATIAAKRVAAAVAKVGMTYKVDGKTYQCLSQCKTKGKEIVYSVGDQETSCEVEAKLMVAQATIRTILEGVAAAL